MSPTNTLTFLIGASIAFLSFTDASPTPLTGRAVTELNREAFEEAHKRDNGATRAFSNTQIKTSDGQCLFIDQLSGDFRANLTPIQIAACDGSQGQAWDIITSGAHNNVPGKMLVVNTLTQACLDLNQLRTGREVTGFSCGGRAAGEGVVTVDQLFPFPASAQSFPLTTDRGNGNCLAAAGSAISIARCDTAAANQLFSIGGNSGNGAGAAPANPPTSQNPGTTSSTAQVPPTSTQEVASTTAAPLSTTAEASCGTTVLANPSTVTVTETITASVGADAQVTEVASPDEAVC